MNPTWEYGHHETVMDIPTPTGGRRGLLGNWGLPATSLSVLSMLTLVLVPVLLLLGDRMRALFRLPAPPGAVAVVAAAVAVLVMVRCRDRPGRQLPRFWLVVLTAGSAVFALLTVFGIPPRPWSDAIALGLVASSLILLARLLELRPDSRVLPWVGTVSAAAAILLVWLPSQLFGWALVERRAADLERGIEHLHALAEEVRQVEDYDWSSLAADPDAAEETVARLCALTLDGTLRSGEVWRVAGVLGREEELVAATSDLVRAVQEATVTDDGPRLAAVSEPAVRWDRERNAWVANPEFPLLSAVVGDYYAQLGRLSRELDDAGGDEGQVPSALTEALRRSRQGTDRWRERTADRWERHWLLAHYDDGTAAEPETQRELSAVLRSELAPGGPRAAELGHLMGLDLAAMGRLAERAPGCHRRAYREDRLAYERLDCYAFRPREEGSGARLRIELRLVYRGRGDHVSPAAMPVELYFLFPIPENRGERDFAEEVIHELSQAVERSGEGAVYAADRGGSVVNGFSVRTDGRSLRVYRPRITDYLGSQRAVEVRCE